MQVFFERLIPQVILCPPARFFRMPAALEVYSPSSRLSFMSSSCFNKLLLPLLHCAPRVPLRVTWMFWSHPTPVVPLSSFARSTAGNRRENLREGSSHPLCLQTPSDSSGPSSALKQTWRTSLHFCFWASLELSAVNMMLCLGTLNFRVPQAVVLLMMTDWTQH